MRRKVFLGVLAAVLAAAGVVVWQAPWTWGQPQQPAAGGGGPDRAAASLPITHVVLFNSGVGYVQREGSVTGDARVDLSFPAGDINDLLKSLVLQDLGGGKISTISYDSHDPIDKILRSFALDLTRNPSFGEILNQARGEKIEVQFQPAKTAKTEKIAGTIVGMEAKKVQVAKDQVVEVELLNLLGPTGLQSIPLELIQSVRFQNPTLENEFRRALQVLASSHDTQKKSVSLSFTGAGKRPVKVGYVVERPIWKTSYRLLIGPNGKLFLQGWAIVENTSDDDWNDIRMVLVSGKPISFKMDLYEPLYIPRPTVEPELFASLRPPVYSGSMEKQEAAEKMLEQARPKNGPTGGFGPSGGGFQFMGGTIGSTTTATATPNVDPQLFQGAVKAIQGRPGFAGAWGHLPANKLTYDELQNRRKVQVQDAMLDQAKRAGSSIAGLNFREGIASVASAEEIGDYFQYVLDQKITLARQKSAMLPILNQNIEGQKVSIYNESIQAKYPLLGLRLKNTSSQPLTQGPIAVFDDNSYAGDTRILDLQPGEERLLSYAVDQGSEVKTLTKIDLSPEMKFKIGADNLTATFKIQERKTYTVKNRSPHDRTLVIEHPIRANWKLIEPAKPLEKSRDVYRFQISVPAGQTVKQEIVEEQGRVDPIALSTPKDVPPFYGVTSGIEVKPIVKTSPDELTELKIVKGVLFAKFKVRESKTYFIQNNSEEDRNFTIDHVVRPDWKRLDAQGKDQPGPAVYRFELKVPKGKTAQQEVTEERVFLDKGMVLKTTGETKVRELLAHPVPSAKVKQALTRSLDTFAQLTESKAQLAETEKQLKTLGDDQSRLRENLKIIPQTAEPYKEFLQKFVTQEKEIEKLQRQIRDQQRTVQQHQQTYETFVTSVNAE